VSAQRGFQRAEVQRKCPLRIVGQMLIVKDQNG